MNAWRMAFRAGKNGPEMWPYCLQLGVAAIQYDPVNDIDLSQYSPGEPKGAWSQLAGTSRHSLQRFVHEMKVGDMIYVKKGPVIVGKGVVNGPYQFDDSNRIQEPNGTYWQHQRPVSWVPYIPEVRIQIGRQQVVTLVKLTAEDIKGIEKVTALRFAEESDIEGTKTEVVHLKSKRSRKLRDLALKAANGICCVCQRDYSKVLGGQGVRVLQVHHRDQLSTYEVPSVTKVSDLAVVCANCHMLLHLNPKKALSVEELRKMLQADGLLKHA